MPEQRYALIGNPVMSAAEALDLVGYFDSIEDMQRLCDDSLLGEVETINGCRFTFKDGTVLRRFNGPYDAGKLRRLCRGAHPNGYWETHGHDCPGGLKPDEYRCFGSPVYIDMEDPNG